MAQQEKNKVKNKKQQNQGCTHLEKLHYAKGMCKDCYNKTGRKKLAFECVHTNKPNYALGMCNRCYYTFYNSKLRYKNSSNNKIDESLASNNGSECSKSG